MLLYVPQHLEMGWRIIFPSFLSDFAQVFLSVVSFLFSILSLVSIEMSHTRAAMVRYMNSIRYLRDIAKPFKKFVTFQTKWNDRKKQNTFMSILRAH
jgi:hypothetical protein